MRIKNGFVCLIVISTVLGFQISIAGAEISTWMTARQLKPAMKKARRTGQYPASLKCRNSPKAKVTARPQIHVVWKENTTKLEWAIYMYKGLLDFQPSTPGKQNKWKRVTKSNFRGGPGGTNYRCSLFYRKK